uniref:Ig-like domain-containing protein n=1 Tax=Canis lupus familiaris TaxID=9615 RepID=A0A8P0NY52_CANLF
MVERPSNGFRESCVPAWGGLCSSLRWLTIPYSECSVSGLGKPRQMLTLTCSFSGFSLNTSVWVIWVPQPPGERLWSQCITNDRSSTSYADAVKGRFTISRDNAKNTLYLQMNSLGAEDTAVYYCVKQRVTTQLNEHVS